MYEYDNDFYAYLEPGSRRSAQAVLPVLLKHLPIRSVMDVGCGRGMWLGVWRELGVEDVVGVDGPYVDRKRLHIPAERFQPNDVSKPFDLGRRFDLVSSLEVAEHLPRDASPVMVDNLTRHGSMVMFSAAVPGQGGENHVNERPLEFWRDLFAAKGYRLFDAIRPAVVANPSVESWYRYNTLLYVHDDSVAALPEVVKATRIADGAPIPDLSPAMFKLRKQVLKRLSPDTVTQIALIKHKLHLMAAKPARSA